MPLTSTLYCAKNGKMKYILWHILKQKEGDQTHVFKTWPTKVDVCIKALVKNARLVHSSVIEECVHNLLKKTNYTNSIVRKLCMKVF